MKSEYQKIIESVFERNKQDNEFYQNHGYHINLDYAYLYPPIFN